MDLTQLANNVAEVLRNYLPDGVDFVLVLQNQGDDIATVVANIDRIGVYDIGKALLTATKDCADGPSVGPSVH